MANETMYYRNNNLDTIKFKNKCKLSDLETIFLKGSNYSNYYPEELAIISYLSDVTHIDNTPMLFDKNGRRIYTYDIPLKMINFFNRKIQLTPDERGFIQKTQLPYMNRFYSDNGFTKSQWEGIIKFFKNKDDFFNQAYEISIGYQQSVLVEGALIGNFNPAFATFLAKNITEYKDEINVNSNINTIGSLSDKSDDELLRMLSSGDSVIKSNNTKEVEIFVDDNNDNNNIIIEKNNEGGNEYIITNTE